MKTLSALIAAVALATATIQAAPAAPSKTPGSSAILLGVDSVQKELKLTSLQRAVLNDIRNEYRDASRDITAKVTAGQQTKAKGLANLEALTAGSDRRALRVLNDDQKKRLEEIRHQILGGYMLLSPALQTKLGLSEAQKTKIAKIEARSEKNIAAANAAFEAGKISYYQRIVNLRNNRLDRSEELIDVLTPPQYGKLAELEGEEFVH
jgi:Spy/CpxP family protein refolding chaperone